MNKKSFTLLIVSLLFVGMSFANNLNITNVTTPSNNSIEFDIEWDNSWYINYAPNNWDAVWIFVKAQDCAAPNKDWHHVDLSTNSLAHSAGAGLQVDAVTDGKGVFVRRAAFGTGNISTTTVLLQLQNTYNLADVVFDVIGIEMVMVPTGAFYVGGGTPNFNYSFNNSQITSENAIPAGGLSYTGTTSNRDYNPAIPADFPKGYNQFYIMKYEISQEQYVQFLNSLNRNQQVARTARAPFSPVGYNALASSTTAIQYRNGVRVQTPVDDVASPTVYGCDIGNNGVFNEPADGQNVACNYLKWEDLLAYLDWSALRPMTELEYEKSCRGTFPVIASEYAWGNTALTTTRSNQTTNTNLNNEISNVSITSPNGLSAIAGTNNTSYGPLRVGFAATATSTRETAGASYWGVLDLTGNVWEQTVSAGYSNGNISSFQGTHGDGILDPAGNADVADWSTTPLHVVVRGGSWASSSAYGRVGDRYYVGTTTYTQNRHQETGGRGVRNF